MNKYLKHKKSLESKAESKTSIGRVLSPKQNQRLSLV